MNNNSESTFGAFVTPHLDAAYNLARWIVTDPNDAADVVQDACIKAMNGFASYRGGSERSWMLTIVRNTAYNFLRDSKRERFVPLDDAITASLPSEDMNPEVQLVRGINIASVQSAIESLAPEYREIVVLKEIEELSYKEIAELCSIPIGTVMSRLSRARIQLRDRLIKMEDVR
ncbi:MAG TPA: sigma-70 family RNA polymerase sigma factor [Candidatus Kapabacteria bacterium]|nr:sigma-70 family RNA polymerase sigma factor [Candidatus Kapabacteria bacterium]